jgi:hypothetical protein
VAGGEPTVPQLAALALALRPTTRVPQAADPARASWARAALLEGVGLRPFHSYVDLDRYHRSIV